MMYWESIAAALVREGFLVHWGKRFNGETVTFSTEAEKEGKRYVAIAEDLTVSFLELQRMVRESSSAGEEAER